MKNMFIMGYKFDFKTQAIYGLMGFFLTFLLILIFIRQVNLVASFIVGIFNFIISGFYTDMNVKSKKKKKLVSP